MKRSEMIEIMTGAFRGAQSFKTDKAMFEYVLRKMENVIDLHWEAEEEDEDG